MIEPNGVLSDSARFAKQGNASRVAEQAGVRKQDDYSRSDLSGAEMALLIGSILALIVGLALAIKLLRDERKGTPRKKP